MVCYCSMQPEKFLKDKNSKAECQSTLEYIIFNKNNGKEKSPCSSHLEIFTNFINIILVNIMLIILLMLMRMKGDD